MKMVTNLCSNLILCSNPTKEKRSVQVATRNIYVLGKTLGKNKTSKKDWTHKKSTRTIKQKESVKYPPLCLISVLIEANYICTNISNDIH